MVISFQEYLTPEQEFGGGFKEFDDDFEGWDVVIEIHW